MQKRLRNYSENCFIVNRQNKRTKSLETEGEDALPIPIDLVFEIFSRLSVKSIARCRCVSKIWASILRRREFTQLYLNKSYGRPQLLFACQYGSELSFFSSPQPQNLDENSPPIIANYLMRFSFDGEYKISGVVNGLVCVIKDKRLSNGKKVKVPVIFNPSTRKSLPLKKVNTSRVIVKSMFGYDPIDKGFKVLTMTWGYRLVNEEHQVLTLGTDKWRMVKYCIPGCYPSVDKGLCINGVLYYQSQYEICCFDIRSEKSSFIKVNKNLCHSTLINYRGNLGLIWSVNGFNHTSTSLQMWVLEDVERQEWSKRNIVLPPLWKDVVGENRLRIVGVTSTNEIVFHAYPCVLMLPLYIFYLNTDKNTIVRVEIQGMDRYKYGGIRIFMNHVENVMLI